SSSSRSFYRQFHSLRASPPAVPTWPGLRAVRTSQLQNGARHHGAAKPLSLASPVCRTSEYSPRQQECSCWLSWTQLPLPAMESWDPKQRMFWLKWHAHQAPAPARIRLSWQSEYRSCAWWRPASGLSRTRR
uniref:Secreted protein n=1 Tax=Macrostomum lignano TaxID=282301 RepID=A0A1I8FEA5_9PLAT